mgnify:CR=1 FL=1
MYSLKSSSNRFVRGPVVSQPDFKVSTVYYQVENGHDRDGLGSEENYFWKTAKERSADRAGNGRCALWLHGKTNALEEASSIEATELRIPVRHTPTMPPHTRAHIAGLGRSCREAPHRSNQLNHARCTGQGRLARHFFSFLPMDRS